MLANVRSCARVGAMCILTALVAILAATALPASRGARAAVGAHLTSSPAGAVVRAAAPLVPASGVLLGAWVDPDGKWVSNTAAQDEVAAFEASIGRTLAINHHNYGWTQSFPSGLEQWDLASGRIPMISWHGTALDSINDGSQDAIIAARADALKALGDQVFLRWGWEMNGNWYPWDGTHNNDPGKTNGPAKYVAAWRRIHTIFRDRGATNVVFVWCPGNSSWPTSDWNDHENYYPGDEYVDWVGVDGYNWGTTQSWSSWRSFSQIFGSFYADYASRKPIMIAETGSQEAGGDKATWMANAAAAMRSNYPAIAAFVYFHAPSGWLVTSSDAALAAFAELAQDPYFGATAVGEDSTPPAITGLQASPQPLKRRSKITFHLSEDSTVSVLIADAGEVIRHRLVDASMVGGSKALWWYGKDDTGKRLGPGMYTIRVIAVDAAGNSSTANAPIQVA
jgi:hypothetical protein